MVGSALCRALEADSNNELILRDRHELNLLDQLQVNQFFQQQKIDQVYLAAAKVGGIYANNMYPAQFIYENLMIQANVIQAAHLADVNSLLALGSSCIYPRDTAQPISEEQLMTGALEPTNAPYALAKISGIELCTSYKRQYGRDYRAVMPTNLYGPGDNYSGQNSHVIPALLIKVHEAKINGAERVTIWGSGQPKREFLFVDDLARACLTVMNSSEKHYQQLCGDSMNHLNIGVGKDLSIKDLAELICNVVGFEGDLDFDRAKPDGTPRKCLDISKIVALGWQPAITLEEGLKLAYQDYCQHYA